MRDMYDAARQHSSDLYSTGDFVDDYAVDPEERNDPSFSFEVVVRRRVARLSAGYGTAIDEEDGTR
ncbi:MAG TPA: hypothetical protein VFU46_06355 [Gemmatimonadales bacterium]|nr:hypothetical protein [Gemmatimonadales bacterium]